MIQKNSLAKKRKKERIKINTISDFKDALKKEGYELNEYDKVEFKKEISKIFEVDNYVIDSLYTFIDEGKITYKANDVKGLINYIKKILVFEEEHNKLCKKISTIKILNIDRIEYDREPRIQEEVDDLLRIIEKLSSEMSEKMSEKDRYRIEELEEEIEKDYLYAKDIELLKKMLCIRKEEIKETYNSETQVKTISIEIPEEIGYQYIKAEVGTVEYNEHLNKNIPRIQRLIKNLHKYMKVDENEESTFMINQSEALQDSINIAVAVFNNKEFRAISGSDEVEGFCIALPSEKTAFKSSKVNKLGRLGIGYNRVNDSEKKIFEEIHKQIEEKTLSNKGNIVLYSKWEPCLSCYLVINQFIEKHPNIKVKVKYIKKYGE